MCALPAVLLALGACAPATFALRVQAAERAVHEAESDHAEERATYELMLSRLYLDKAREEAGESHYALALALARRAVQSAQRARVLSRARAAGAAE